MKGQVITQGLCKERVLLLFLPKSGGVGVGVETKRGGEIVPPAPHCSDGLRVYFSVALGFSRHHSTMATLITFDGSSKLVKSLLSAILAKLKPVH